MKLTKNIEEANAITHAGTFHADEVFATVILSKLNPNLVLLRAPRMPDQVPQETIVYDIGLGTWDHHQKEKNGTRENGIPYASAGLIWRDFGPDVCKEMQNPKKVWKIVDKELIQWIDAEDNGFTLSNAPSQGASISLAIEGFHPTWDSQEDEDEAFMRAYTLAQVIFDNELKYAHSKARAKALVDAAILESDGKVLILEQYMPWQESIFRPDKSTRKKANSMLFVVYPSNRGGYNWYAIPNKPGGLSQRKQVPIVWHGLSGEALQQLTGVKTATFVHPNGFIGGAETFADAIRLAEIAAKANPA